MSRHPRKDTDREQLQGTQTSIDARAPAWRWTYPGLVSALAAVPSWPVPTAAAGWINGAGGTDRIGPTGQGFALASVTKPLFAYAVLVAVEEGTLALDQPAGPPGSTIAHLLAHASGLGPDTTTTLFGPGLRRIYSNGGFDVLGRELEQAAGMSATQYLHEAVLAPLGMTATALHGSPAHAARGSVDDLLRLGAEWLAPTLIHPSTMATATTPMLADLAGILPGFGRQDPNPWGLGFEIRGTKTPHWTGSRNSTATFGHFGRAGTFIWVDPDAQVACVALTDRDFGPWAAHAWPPFADAVLAEAASP